MCLKVRSITFEHGSNPSTSKRHSPKTQGTPKTEPQRRVPARSSFSTSEIAGSSSALSLSLSPRRAETGGLEKAPRDAPMLTHPLLLAAFRGRPSLLIRLELEGIAWSGSRPSLLEKQNKEERSSMTLVLRVELQTAVFFDPPKKKSLFQRGSHDFHVAVGEI